MRGYKKEALRAMKNSLSCQNNKCCAPSAGVIFRLLGLRSDASSGFGFLRLLELKHFEVRVYWRPEEVGKGTLLLPLAPRVRADKEVSLLQRVSECRNFPF